MVLPDKDTTSFDPLNQAVVEEMDRESESYILSNDALDFHQLLEATRIRPTDIIDKPPGCLYVVVEGKEYVIGSLGDISTVTGKAKSKKTFAVSIAVAAAVSGAVILNRIKGALPPNQNVVLLFDTEQSQYYVWKLLKRICRLIGVDDPPNLMVYSLRGYDPHVRLGMIDEAIRTTPGVGLVVIDGSRDLAVDPVLDGKEASQIITHLLRWTATFNIHIMTVLHQNKADRNMRGVLGTELTNKSETVIEVTRDEIDKGVSHVEPKDSRSVDFPPFSFSVDDIGLPYLIEDNSRKATGKFKKKESLKTSRAITPSQLTDEQHHSILHQAFADVKPGKYKETCHRIRAAAESLGYKFGENRAKEFVTFYSDKRLLRKTETGQTYLFTLQSDKPVDGDSATG